MDLPLRAIEVTGTIDAERHLHLDAELPVAGPQKVRVIVLCAPDDNLSEAEWLAGISSSPAFASLNDPVEDIYTIQDGKPFHRAQE